MLIRLTMKHREFSIDYCFRSNSNVCILSCIIISFFMYIYYLRLLFILFYQNFFKQDWFLSDIGMKSSMVKTSTNMIAVDCEMVLCEDGTEAVVRVGAVDRHGKVYLIVKLSVSFLFSF